jgi:hypothetical protein
MAQDAGHTVLNEKPFQSIIIQTQTLPKAQFTTSQGILYCTILKITRDNRYRLQRRWDIAGGEDDRLGGSCRLRLDLIEDS